MKDADRQLLEQAFGAQPLRIEPLSGGLLGRCYRVTGKDIDAAVRLPGQHGLRLSHEVERNVVTRVAAAGLGPTLVTTPAELGLIATRFLADARTWTAADARQPRNIDRASALLKRLHALDIELAPFECTAAAASYAQAASTRLGLTAEQCDWRDELVTLARAFDAEHRPSVPCHNDLVASNVLDDGRLWLVDFEFAAQASPILDLANLAAFNELDSGARTRLLDGYFGASRTPFDVTWFEQTIRLVRLLAYFWILAEPGPDDAWPAVGAFAEGVASMLR